MPKVVDHDQRRTELLAALWRVVDRDGAQHVSVRTVAAEAGVSKTSVGYYFASQGALLATALEQSVETVTVRILAMDLLECDVDTATDALLVLIPQDPQRRRHAEVWLQLLTLVHSDPSIGPVLKSLNAAVRDGIVVLLTALANQGLVSTDRDLEQEAVALHALIDGFSVHTLTDRRLDSRKQIRATVRAAVDSLASPPSPRGGAPRGAAHHR